MAQVYRPNQHSMMRFNDESYCFINGWPFEVIKKTADMMSDDFKAPIMHPSLSHKINNSFEDCVLRYDRRVGFIGIWHKSAFDHRFPNEEVSYEKVLYMIKEREMNSDKFEVNKVYDSLYTLQKLCKDSDLDITVYGDGYTVFDGMTERQGILTAKQLIKLSEVKREYIKLTEGFN